MKRHSDTSQFDQNRKDRETINAVRHRLEHSRHKGLRRVKSKIYSGTITLSGHVPTEEDRELAIDIVGSFEDVEGVIDNLEVVAP